MIKKYFYPLLLALIIGVLCYANYTPGTILSGWDTLHPEFNFSLAFERIFNGVWRSDQGLGATAIHSHMAELPRVILLWITSFVLPMQFLRYAFFFTCLLLGPLGIYVLTKNFTSAIIYLANLGTVQIFAVPFEMFATQYALLPWLFFYTKKSFDDKKYVKYFAAVSLLASPMAYAATLWYAFFLCFILFLFANRQSIKKSLILIAILLATNAYWILPNIYATITHGNDVREAKVNQLFTPEAVAKGQKFATLKDAALIKNFLFDWELYRFDKNRFAQVLAPWQEHLKNPWVQGTGYSIFALAIFGIFKAIKKKDRFLIAVLPMFGASLLMLLWQWPLPGILAEALRFPFTKFSILFMFCLSIFAGYALPKRLTIVASLALLFYFYPAIKGNLIHPAMRITIPNQYFEMFDWFDKQSNDERIALLPIHSFYNWTYYDWGYQGAGFLQFGIPQPILDRDYDRWNRGNEQYMREMTYAVYSQKPELLRSVLEKFTIEWIVMDESVTNVGARPEATFMWAIPELLAQTEIVTLEKEFGEHIKVFKVKKLENVKVNLPSIGPILDGAPEDTAYSYFGSYITKETNSYTDPYRQAFTHDERFTFDVTDKIPMAETDKLEHKFAYLVRVTHKNISGFPIQLCISNPYNRKCDLMVRLKKSATSITEQFLLPPINDFASGYSVNIDNLKIGNIVSENVLENVSFYQINYDEITGKNTGIAHAEQNTIVTNNEAFDLGWLAFSNRKLLNNHVLVNNWENGWIVPTRSNDATNNEVTFFYWPQILEYMGLLLLIIPFLLPASSAGRR